MTLAAATALLLAVWVPHVLPQERLAPLAGAAIWLAALSLHALVAVATVAALVIYVPTTRSFEVVTGWCLDNLGPWLTDHWGVSGHGIGEILMLVPSVLLMVSALWGLGVLTRDMRTTARWLRRSSVGTGPLGSVIVTGSDLLVGAAGLRAPRIVISAGALTQLDDAELQASLEHERGHIVHRHRYVLIVANVLFTIARFLPGSQRAYARLGFYLERDADEFALSQGRDSLALASAICKAAVGSSTAVAPGLTRLAGGDTITRLNLLIRPGSCDRATVRWWGLTLTATLTAAAMAAAVLVPEFALAAADQLHTPAAIVHC